MNVKFCHTNVTKKPIHSHSQGYGNDLLGPPQKLIQRSTVKVQITCIEPFKKTSQNSDLWNCLYLWQCLVAYSYMFSNALGKVWYRRRPLYSPDQVPPSKFYFCAREELAGNSALLWQQRVVFKYEIVAQITDSRFQWSQNIET